MVMGRKLGASILICIIIILLIITFLCHIIALATSHWLRSSDSVQSNFLHIGLFDACFDDYVHPHENPPKTYDDCHPLQSDYYATIQDWLVPSWLTTCKILAIIALILMIVGTLFLLLLILWILCKWIACDSDDDICEKILSYTTPILFILAGMFLMMTVMIFADNAFRLQCKDFWLGGDPNDNRLAFSWGFELASCIFCFITGGFIIWLVVVKTRDNY